MTSFADPDPIRGPDELDRVWAGVVDRALRIKRVAANTRERQRLVGALLRLGSLALPLVASPVTQFEFPEDFNAVLQVLAYD